MLARIYEYRGVILFYLLFLLIIFSVSYRNKVMDLNTKNDNYIETAS